MNGETSGPRRGRAAALLILKLAVTGSLIAWVFSRIDLRDLGAGLKASLSPWLIAAVLVAATNVTLGAARWRLMLTALGSPLPLGRAIRLVWAGLFFNTFLPTGVVGDALRGGWTAKLSDRARAYWSVVLDRVTALGALMLLAAVGLTLPRARELPAAPTLALACVVLGLPALLVLAAPQQLARLLARFGGARVRRALEGRVTDPPPAGPRWKALALASGLHLLVVLDVALLARAAHLQVPWAVLLAVVPAVLVASYLPVSISGIGVREVALVELFGQAGVPAAGALTVSLLILAISIALSLVGGLVYLASGGQPGAAPPPA
jgi:glycosyltransferase 2 family protein